MRFKILLLMIAAAFVGLLPAAAHDAGQPVESEEDAAIAADADIVVAQVVQMGSSLYFHMIVRGDAGAVIPEATGAVAGAGVASYVWPTSLDSSVVGFEPEQGILALAVTSHPDFDDTPLWDEDGDGDATNDGALWHSHWVVLVADEACGAGGLKVRDIPEGETPAVPATWPELPILIDSPDYALELSGHDVVVTVPHDAVGGAEAFSFDGVTAGLQVNADLHNPFLCVVGVSDIASGDLSLPGVSGH
ncbi:MAG: hypothetical protein KME04_04875 [Pleurocapsa minor GSE-CHR-MK-17-07R]|jgi:hypothetical protein|nr:hypothetical protein [Pleurocapsa minor GSE-CHR-MK 17-07R]